ncbi:MAG TPA: hypothetical protein VNA26_03875, partial [Chitinophagaceae bacterium]|nr:hypothetical protein [Chitinophagaceae bacterium]
ITNNGNGGSDPNSYFLYNGIAFLQSRGVQVGATHIFNLFIPVPGNTSWGIWQTNGRRVAAITERYMINLTSANPGIVNGALGLWGHELGHAYGLDHPIPDDQTTIMSTPNGLSKYPNCVLLPHEKNILLNNGFFF